MHVAVNEWQNILKSVKFRHPQHLHKCAFGLQRNKIHEIQIKMQIIKILKNAGINPQNPIKNRHVQGDVP